MVQFAHECPEAFATLTSIGQPAVAQLPAISEGQHLVAQIPWAHNVLLMQRVKNKNDRLWYIQQTLANGWSRNVLLVMIQSDEFYIDLLFYHLKLRCFVVIDLKKGEFKPEYAGKMNFYLSVVDDQLRHPADAPSIGLILCQDRNHIVAGYALRAVDKPIGISEYELTRALPPSLQSASPTVEEIEADLAESATKQADSPKAKKPNAVKVAMPALKKQSKKGRKK